jgi:proteasome lid subunit RPN8/RPN11
MLPASLRNRLADEACRALPRECCGLLEGVQVGPKLRITAVHPTRNLATERDRFEIDPAEQIQLLKTLRGTGRDVVGCYHSHPNGRPEPSPRDREYAFGGDFLWLIVALGNDAEPELGAYEIQAEGHRLIPIAPETGSSA